MLTMKKEDANDGIHNHNHETNEPHCNLVHKIMSDVIKLEKDYNLRLCIGSEILEHRKNVLSNDENTGGVHYYKLIKRPLVTRLKDHSKKMQLWINLMKISLAKMKNHAQKSQQS